MTVRLSLLSNLYIINRFLLQKLCNIVLKPLKMKFTKTHMPFSKMACYHGMTHLSTSYMYMRSSQGSFQTTNPATKILKILNSLAIFQSNRELLFV